MTVAQKWNPCLFTFYAGTIALCIVCDILQYSAVLSFLPQSLEEQGHTAIEIASVIGSYYWAGFLGGSCITIYQIKRVLQGVPTVLKWRHLRCHIVFLIAGLFGGTVALTLEGLFTHVMMVHLVCRLVLGFLGAFLFFFAFLLSIELYVAGSSQQNWALTLSSMALHCAEVFGPFLGAVIFTHYGQSMTFYALAAMSGCVQVLLLAMRCTLPNDDPADEDAQQPLLATQDSSLGAGSISAVKRIFTSPMMWKSALVIMPAAMIKASLEAILPLFADHKLRYDEFQIGLCFSMVAIAFLTTSMILSACWSCMQPRARTALVAMSMISLGGVACSLLLSFQYGGPYEGFLFPVDPEDPAHRKSYALFYFWLVLFGITSAGCFTPSAYFIGEYVDMLDDSAMKDCANGIWNTLWEVGGSLGLFLAGIPSTRSWFQEHLLFVSLGGLIIVFAVAFLYISRLAEVDLKSGSKTVE